MTIQISDIKLLESAVMADVPEGGGAASGKAIADGVSNAIFPDISELDRAGGRVNMRKVVAQVASSNADLYFGSNVIVAEPPTDPRVSVTLFKAADAFERRAGAISRMESYLNKGAMAVGYLYENHIAGQRAIQLFMQPQDQEPNVGQVLVLVLNEGLPTQVQQYVRTTKVASVIRNFKKADGTDYKAKIVTCDLSDALRTDFAGSPASEFFKPLAGKTLLRETLVADAGIYVGCVPLAQAANVGDFTIKAASMFSPLVPSAQTEVPMAALLPYADLQTPVQGVADVSYTAAQNWTPALALVLPSPAAPGSIRINAGAVTDNGAGILLSGGAQFGTVDYANGICTINTGSLNGAKAVTYRPAGFVLRAPRSMETRITIESRSLSYAGVLAPLPSPGTLSIHYRAQGRWYVLREAGGIIKGSESSYGAGTYNASTGSYIITLGALPDVGSSIIFVWGAQADELALPSAPLQARQSITLGGTPRASSLTLSWPHESGTGTRSALVNAVGQISGDATGTVRGDVVDFVPTKLPANGAAISVSYNLAGSTTLETPSATAGAGGAISFTAGGAIAPGSLDVRLGVRVKTEAYLSADDIAFTQRQFSYPARFMVQLRDDGAGAVLLQSTPANGGSVALVAAADVGKTVGSVDYATGEVTLYPAAFSVSMTVMKSYPGWL